jgi:hypothetical protein
MSHIPVHSSTAASRQAGSGEVEAGTEADNRTAARGEMMGGISHPVSVILVLFVVGQFQILHPPSPLT